MKNKTELQFWKEEKARYQQWYDGNIILNNRISPLDYEKQIDAINTWIKVFQEPEYLNRLDLDEMSFIGQKVLDVGCGPVSGVNVFKQADVYGVDHLINEYKELGFNINDNFKQGNSENIPFKDNFFDVVISNNALDHVDDLEITSNEIKRVLKKNGKVALNLHYHTPTICEPIELNDDIVFKVFDWIPNFKKIKEQENGRVIWRNF